jgi:cAMP-dependent protein kinase regulator/CRP/FNR family cyclic AMP-dependent transcriptional regulator/cGMP-dependent protein kinase 2
MDIEKVKAIPLFALLSEKEQKMVAHLADEVDAPAGMHLVDEGKFAHEFFVILEGTADVVHDNKVVATLGPGDFFGEIALMAAERRNASVIAKEPMRLVVIFGPNFRSLAGDLPEVSKRIDEAIKARTR